MMKQKNLKKVTALVLCSVLCMGTTAYASEESSVILEVEKDIYGAGMEETINIEGINYTYKYYYGEDGSREIRVENNANDEVEIIKYDEDASEVLVNDEVVATVSDVEEITDTEENMGLGVQTAKASRWKYIGTIKKKFSWKKNIAVSTAAGVIASVIPLVNAATVMAKIGLGVLSGLAKYSVKGTVTIKTYQLKAGKVTNNKFVWTVVANGKKYGPYTSYVTT